MFRRKIHFLRYSKTGEATKVMAVVTRDGSQWNLVQNLPNKLLNWSVITTAFAIILLFFFTHPQPPFHMNKQVQLLKKIADLSEDEKLALFSVEELENRLEMTAVAGAEVEVNGICWIG